MSYTPCTGAQRWPELWARLPDDRARQGLSNALANGRLEGMGPTRELVEDQLARSRGEMSRDECQTRSRARAGVRARRRSRDALPFPAPGWPATPRPTCGAV